MKKLIFIVLFICSVSLYANYESDLLNRVKPVEKKYDSMITSAKSTVEMVNAIGYASNEWDDELNKVYKLLMSSLSKDKQSTLRNTQRNWIKERDKKISQASNSGGTADLINGNSVFLEETKKRTLELAKSYDKLKNSK